MAELTVEQVGRRRASKKNNRLRRDMPLFAEALQPGAAMADWLTTAESETRAVEENRRRAADNLAALVDAKQERAEREAELRAQAMAGKSADDAAFLDERRRIVATVPHFLAAAFLVQSTDLVVTLAERVARRYAKMLPLATAPSPVTMPRVIISQLCHERALRDPAQRWLRSTLLAVAKTV